MKLVAVLNFEYYLPGRTILGLDFEDDISEEKLNNSVIAKLMSVSYNIIQFVMDSHLFNRILYDIFHLF